jgi:hypothetical protein
VSLSVCEYCTVLTAVWPTHSLTVRLLCRKDKIAGLLEQSRGRDPSKERKDLLVEMALFITSTDAAAAATDKTATSGSNSDGKGSTAEPKATKRKQSSSTNGATESDRSPPSNSTNTKSGPSASDAGPRSLPKIFSKRAMECRVGSIHDFVAVLLSPGRADHGPWTLASQYCCYCYSPIAQIVITD